MNIADIVFALLIVIFIIIGEKTRRSMGAITLKLKRSSKDFSKIDLLFIIILSISIYNSYTSQSLVMTELIAFVALTMCLIYFSSLKKSIRKNGIVFYENLISWKDIKGYKWNEHDSGDMFYHLEIKKKSILKPTIQMYIHKSQKQQVHNLLNQFIDSTK